jgi:hypothetical protein
LYSKPNPFISTFKFILAVLVIAGFTWFNFHITEISLGGEEFYTQWAAGRSLMYAAENPYRGSYEFPAIPNFGVKAGELVSLKLNTPIYSLLLLLPFLLIEDFKLAFTAWLVLSEICLSVVFWACFRLSDWKPKRFMMFFVFIFLGLGYYTTQALTSGSLIILASLFLLLSLLELRSERAELAGILLAFTTILLQYFVLIYILLIIWAISTRKWNFIAWFLASIFILSILGMFVVPDWVMNYLQLLWNYKENFSLWTISGLLVEQLPGIGRQMGWLFLVLMLVISGIEWIIVRRKEFRRLYWTVCLSIVTSQWLGLPLRPSEFFILVIPLILIVSVLAQRAGKVKQSAIAGSLITLLVVPWLVAFGQNLPKGLVSPGLSHFFFLPPVLLIGLYWVRWWAIRPQRLFVEELRSSETT